MRRLLSIFLLVCGVSASAVAQEGHPLKGSWIGEWSGNEALGDFVLLVMNWDGKEVTGVINPGTDNIAIESVELDPSDWSVTIEGGEYEIEGKIENLELQSRAIVGTWKQGRNNGNFEISRQ
jgi:hypothetical protein